MEQSRTAYVILGMLAIQDGQSGYDLRKGIESTVGNFWSESYGQLYPALKRLAADGLIVPAPAFRKQRRQAWSITADGRISLRDWLALPFQNDPPRNEFLLKLFFGLEAPAGVTVAHIRELQKRNLRAIAVMEEIQAVVPKINAGNPHLPYWMMTVDLGMAMTRAAIDWGERTLAELEANGVSALQSTAAQLVTA
jgi:PadR family transcriptional regulator AphA